MMNHPVSQQELQLQQAARWHGDGQFEKAEQRYLELIKQRYDLHDTYNLLGILYLQTKNFPQAIEHLQAAIDAGQSSPDTLFNLGLAYAESKQFPAAIDRYRQCVTIKPDHHSGWYNLALSLEKEERFDEAIEALHKDFDITRRPEAQVELSTVYIKKFDWDETEKYAVAALKLKPDSESAMHNLANALLGRHGDKEFPELPVIERVLRLGKAMIAADPNSYKGYSICGDALNQAGEQDLALDHYLKSLSIKEDNPTIQANVSVLLLQRGELEEGWQRIAYREDYGKKLYGMDTKNYYQCPATEWRGQIEPGKHLLISSEQGIGDQIMQAQLVVELLQQGMQVTMTCTDKLAALLTRSIPAATIVASNAAIAQEQLNRIDYKVTQLDLCRFMRPSMNRFVAAPAHYLTPDPTQLDTFRKRYQPFDQQLKIGIAWRSASKSCGNLKSTKLLQWEEILTIPGIAFFSIQYGDVTAEVAQVKQQLGIDIYVDPDFNPFDDVEKAAAQIAAMDMIVSVSNASVHLSGSMGIPTKVILHHSPLWHWFLNRSDSVWYQSLELYRQQQLSGWSPVLHAIASDLQKIAAEFSASHG